MLLLLVLSLMTSNGYAAVVPCNTYTLNVFESYAIEDPEIKTDYALLVTTSNSCQNVAVGYSELWLAIESGHMLHTLIRGRHIKYLTNTVIAKGILENAQIEGLVYSYDSKATKLYEAPVTKQVVMLLPLSQSQFTALFKGEHRHPTVGLINLDS